MGRFGILAELPTAEEGGGEVPWLCGYSAEAIRNWSEGRELFVVDESEYEIGEDGFTWTKVEKYRELRLEDGVYKSRLWREGETTDAVETKAEQQANEPLPDDAITEAVPNVTGGQALEEMRRELAARPVCLIYVFTTYYDPTY